MTPVHRLSDLLRCHSAPDGSLLPRKEGLPSSLFRAHRPCVRLLPRRLLRSPSRSRGGAGARDGPPALRSACMSSGWPGLWLRSQVPPSGAGVAIEQASVCVAPSWPGGYLPADSTQAPSVRSLPDQPVSSSCVSRPFPCLACLPTDTFVYINTWSLASCPQTAGRPQGS